MMRGISLPDLLEHVKIKFVFHALTFHGKPVKKIIELSVPNFQYRKDQIHDYDFSFSAMEQLDTYMSELDKSELMDQYGFQIIYNWDLLIPKPKPEDKRVILQNLLKECKANEQMTIDFFSIYDQVEHKIRRKNVKNQFEHVMDIMHFSIKYASGHMTELLDNLKAIWHPENKELENKRKARYVDKS